MPLSGPLLEVNLRAITCNYERLKRTLGRTECAAVVKANAYGLGVATIAPALYRAGCRVFFVANLAEGVELRELFEEQQIQDAVIYVFHGVRSGEKDTFIEHQLIPVINDPAQLAWWDKETPCAIHVDTGMCRLGFTARDVEQSHPQKYHVQLLLSHLACANDASNPKNAKQLNAFKTFTQSFANVPASFANSSGIFLGQEYHYDIARPGCALYGISPRSSRENPMESVVTLSAPVLQYRTIDEPQSVGYGATAIASAGSVLATVEIGYADGLKRILSNHLHGLAMGYQVPIVGRISMDMVSVDVTAVPEHLRTPDLRITFISNEQTVDKLADAAHTIGYEMFTSLGNRIKRVYGY